MSIVRANRWQRADGSNLGTVLQTVSVIKTDTFSTTTTMASGGTQITGLSATITPYSTSNKILVMCNLQVHGTNTITQVYSWLARGTIKIGVGDAAGSRQQIGGRFYYPGTTIMGLISMSVLDSPLTVSPTTYNVYLATESASGSAFLNRQETDTDVNTTTRNASTLILMEIQA